MKQTLTFLTLLFSSFIFGQSPKFDWVAQEGNGSQDFGWRIKKATNGDVYAAIGFQGSTNIGGTIYNQLGTSNWDFVICKYNSAGALQWAKQIYADGNNLVPFPELKIDGSDNLYLMTAYDNALHLNGLTYQPLPGSTQPTAIFCCKIDLSGNILWAKNLATLYGGATNPSYDVNSGGEIILTSNFVDSVKIGPNKYQGVQDQTIKSFFVRFNSLGNSLFVTTEHGLRIIEDIVFDNNGQDFYVGGSFSNSLSFPTGSVNITSAGGSDAYVAKYQGTSFAYCYWAKNVGSGNSDNFSHLITDNGNNVIVCLKIDTSATIYGNYINVNGITKLLNVKFNTSGNCTYVNTIATGNNIRVDVLTKDNAGNMYVCGGLDNTVYLNNDSLISAGNTDALLIKVRMSDGVCIWGKRWGGQGFDIVRADAGSENELFGIGLFSGQVSFGQFTKTALGNYDPYITRLSGCDFPLSNITYNGNTSLCNGQTITLNANAIGGASYQWLKDGAILPNEETSTLVVAGPGNYSIDINLGGGCRDTFGNVIVTTSTLNATIQSAQPSICVGGTLQLYTNLPYSSYNWSIGVSTPTVTINQQGTYSVVVTDGSGCSDTATVTIEEFPLLDTPTILVGNNCQLASSIVVTGYNYKWRLNGNVVGGNAAYLDANQYGEGFYTIEISDVNGCKASSITPLSVACHTGIEEGISLSSLKIYPNPNSGLFTITVQSERREEIILSCFNILGEKVYEKGIALIDSQMSEEINLQYLETGLYIIRISANSSSISQRIIISE